MTKTCARCQATFSCGAEEDAAPCWCAALPRVMPLSDAGCLCPSCLKAEIESIIAAAGLCASCRKSKRLTTKTGSAIYRCALAETDPKFTKFPRLPMADCPGYLKN
ncbi:MAG: cysteine-rich CWC family protein [Elusimicrobiota bacterium]